MRITVGAVLLALMGTASAHARDGFETVRCGGDIVRALVGQRGDNREPVMVTEARHKDLSLKDLGASDYGTFSSITWLICGAGYMVLEDNATDVVRDAIQVPPHSKDRPWFEGFCKRKGKPAPGSVVGILRDKGAKGDLPAEAAWRIDEKRVKFVKVATR